MLRRGLIAVLLLGAAPGQAQPLPDEPGMAPGPPPPTSQPAPPPPTSQSAPENTEVVTPPELPDKQAPPNPDGSWYYATRGRKAGPFTAPQLRDLMRTGLLPGNALVWRPGFEQWVALDAVPEFADLQRGYPVDKPLPRPGERQRIRGLVIGGAITFGVTWGLAVLSSGFLASVAEDCSDCDRVAAVLWIPLAGPLVANFRDDTEDNNAVTVTMVLWTLAQTTGATLLTIGLIGRKTPEPDEAAAGWRVTPLVGRLNGLGISRSW